MDCLPGIMRDMQGKEGAFVLNLRLGLDLLSCSVIYSLPLLPAFAVACLLQAHALVGTRTAHNRRNTFNGSAKPQ